MMDHFNTEGARTRIFKDEHGHVVMRFNVDTREAFVYYTTEEAALIGRALIEESHD